MKTLNYSNFNQNELISALNDRKMFDTPLSNQPEPAKNNRNYLFLCKKRSGSFIMLSKNFVGLVGLLGFMAYQPL